ncbi:hypothetical protein L6164_027537 [Bauhinia variegata]|uniref:Uncharacterized protein n=1 Tax=Bauhinia variegata TaxID=167791 RepID=A0ACB9LTN4_BAUVA|nr:hypothetical protein L6164_027537 [Bauhinia variegata]
MLFRRRLVFFSPSYHQAVARNSSALLEQFRLLLGNNSKPVTTRECKQIHARLAVSQCLSEIHLTNTLVNLYCKCGEFNHACLLFDQMPWKNVVSWTTLISANIRAGSFGKAMEVFKEMCAMGERPNQYTFSALLKGCANPAFRNVGLQIHGLIVHFGLEKDKFAGSCLVHMYSNIENHLQDAGHIFNELLEKDRVTWNVMIFGFAQVSNSSTVVRLFSEMQEVDGLKPDEFTLMNLLKCCSSLEEVKQIHGLALKFGAESGVVMGGALVDLYAKCRDINSCKKLFDSMEEKDGFVWSSIMSGYIKNSRGEEAVHFFMDLCRQGMKLDKHILSSTLKACTEIEDFNRGIQVHAHMIKYGHQNDCFVASVLLTLYANFSELEDARKLFRRIRDRDIVAWNSMILAYAQMEEGSARCMQLLQELRQTSFLQIDGATIVAILKSCQKESDLATGCQIHSLTVKSGIYLYTLAGNALIRMYSECGEIDDAYKAFNDIIWKDDSSWSSIIGTYHQNEMGLEALTLCKEMLADGITFTSYSLPLCLTACSRLSAIKMGRQFHVFVIKSGLNIDVYVGSSIIDMYAKCGNLEESEKAFGEQPEPNEVVYNALISGYAHHGKAEEAREAFNEMERKGLIPNLLTFLAVLSACSHVGYVEESLYYFTLMYQTYKIRPEAEHYSCLIDVYGRAGRLEEAYQLVQKDGSESAWRTLLSACRNYGNTEIAEKSAMKIIELNASDHASYVLLSNMYTGEGKWDEALKWRMKMAKVGVKKDPGSSWLI